MRIRLAAFLIVALGSLGLAELLLRGFGFGHYWALARRAEPDLGWIAQPHVETRQLGEGQAAVRTNRLGFRGPDFAPKAEGVFRIAVLGDSFTEGVQVEEAQTWWGQLGPVVEDCLPDPKRRVEVLNFGVSGYGTGQALLVLEKYALPAEPDLVVLNFFPGNDIQDNSPTLNADPMRPFFRVADGRLERDDGFRASAAWRMRASPGWRYIVEPLLRLRSFQLVVAARDRLATWQTSAQAASPLEAEPGIDLALYREPATAPWIEAWAVTEALLDAFAKRARAAGADSILMLATTGYQTLPRSRRTRFAEHHGLPDLDYPQRRLTAAGAAAGWNVLDLAPVFRFWADQTGVIAHGFPSTAAYVGHWNEHGHAIGARALAARICAGMESARRVD